MLGAAAMTLVGTAGAVDIAVVVTTADVGTESITGCMDGMLVDGLVATDSLITPRGL